MGFFLGRFGVRMCLVGFVGVVIMMVTFLGNALFHLRLRFVKIPEFHELLEMDKSSWPRCSLSCNLLESALGRYSSDVPMGWQLPVGYDAQGAGRAAAEPDVWTDGSLVQDKVSGASSAGAGCFPVAAVIFGRIRGGATWMRMLGMMQLFVPVVVFVLFLFHCSLFRWLSSGCCWPPLGWWGCLPAT